MEQADPRRLAMAFHDAINARDPDALAALMTAEHRFIDSAGTLVAGKQACLDAWRGFFGMFPDYRNDVSAIAVDGPVVAMAGRSQCSDPRLSGQALWRASADGGALGEWRIFEDTIENRKELGLPA